VFIYRPGPQADRANLFGPVAYHAARGFSEPHLMTMQLARRAASGDASPDVLEWIATSMRRHFDGDDVAVSLGLDRVSLIRERNRALNDAAALLDDGTGAWNTALLLERAIRYHQARVIPLLERDPNKAIGPIDGALRRAFQTGQRVPTTARNLYNVIR
jgi:hypothetical protein